MMEYLEGGRKRLLSESFNPQLFCRDHSHSRHPAINDLARNGNEKLHKVSNVRISQNVTSGGSRDRGYLLTFTNKIVPHFP